MVSLTFGFSFLVTELALGDNNETAGLDEALKFTKISQESNNNNDDKNKVMNPDKLFTFEKDESNQTTSNNTTNVSAEQKPISPEPKKSSDEELIDIEF